MDSLFPLQSQDGLGCSVAWLQSSQSSSGFLVCTPKASDNPCQELFYQVSISPTHLLLSCICKFLDLPYCFLREPSFLWWRNKSWFHTHAVLAMHSTSTDNKHVSSASREKQKEELLWLSNLQSWSHAIGSVSAGRQIHFKSQRENSCKTKDVILRLLSTSPSAGQPHLFTKREASPYFNENRKGSGEECEDHLFYQMPELPQVTEWN